MKCLSLMVLLVLLCLVQSAGWAQTQSDQMREIRDQMQALQEKLRTLESSDVSSVTRQRTTQLGHTPVREQEPEIVVRV
jgi:outer membrane lipoprotein-sorting protein